MGKDLKIIWQIFVRDLKRLVRNPIAIVVVLGACLLPSLYAWYCIAANWNPYGNTGSIDVAVANNDEGADSEYTGHLDIGQQVVDKLKDNDELGWKFVDESEAMDGVKEGRYYAAIVIPKEFSADLETIFTGDFTRPKIDYYVNEKLSSVAPKITDQGATTLEKTIDREFVAKVSEATVEITQKVGDEVMAKTEAAESALTDGIEKTGHVIDDARALIADTQPQLEAARSSANATKGSLDSLNDDIPGMLSDIDAARGELGNLRKAVNNYSDALTQGLGSLGLQEATDAASDIRENILPEINSSIDSFSESLGSLAGTVHALQPTLSQASSVLGELSTLTDDSEGALTSADSLLSEVQQSMSETLADIKAIQDAASSKQLIEYLDSNPESIGQFIASPVTLRTEIVYPVANYGSGVAPFYSNLALWVAGFILMALVRLRVDPEGLPEFTPRQAYFGRWLFYVCMGSIQALIVCCGDLVIGIQCDSPVAFVAAGLLAEFVYVNLMYALAKAFRHIGKAIAVLLLIMQIPGSSGMYPVEMMPPFYQYIHPLLPFTYSIDAMREAIGGFYGLHYLQDMVLLAAIFLPIGFFIGMFISKRAYNLNLLFDNLLGRTDLFVTEDVPKSALRFEIRPVIAALLTTKENRSSLISRAKWFEERYPRLIRIGWVAIFALPVATFCMMVAIQADVNTKLLLLCLLVCGVIVVNAYLIIITYMKANIAARLASVGEDAGGARADGGVATDAEQASTAKANASDAEGGDAS